MKRRVLVHDCFDPSDSGYLEVKPHGKLFVRFPKMNCRCHLWVSSLKRDRMLQSGEALVVYGADGANWKEIVRRVEPKEKPQATLASETIGKSHIESAYVHGNRYSRRRIEVYGKSERAKFEDISKVAA